MKWISVEDRLPEIGEMAIFYRPLAEKSGDKQIAIKKKLSVNNFCWEDSVPDGVEPFNPTDGLCHVTHWMPLPSPPSVEG